MSQGVQNQPGHHGKTPSLKIINIEINKCNSLKANLKIFIVFILFFSLIFYPRHFNFDLTVLRILACILGFYILRFFINRSKAKQ